MTKKLEFSLRDDVFDIGKRLARHGFRVKLEYPESVLYVSGCKHMYIHEIRRISGIGNSGCIDEQFDEDLIKIKL